MTQQEYLQMLQMEQQGTPSTPMTAAPPLPKYPSASHVANGNPLSAGADDAIESARKSLSGITPGWRGVLGDTLQDVGRGILQGARHPMVRAIGSGLPSASETHANQLAHNMEILKYIQDRQRAQALYEREQARMIEVQRRQQETERHHLQLENIQKHRYGINASGENGEQKILLGDKEIDISQFSPIKGQSEFNSLQKDKKTYGNVLSTIKEIEKQVDELEKLTEKDWIKPTNPYFGRIAQVKNDIGALGGDESSMAKRNATKVLKDTLASFRAASERASKGGTPGEQMMKRFEEQELLPHATDSASTIRAKLNTMKAEASLRREANELSLKTKRNIDPYDLELLKGETAPEETEKKSQQIDLKPVSEMSTEELEQEANRLMGGK